MYLCKYIYIERERILYFFLFPASLNITEVDNFVVTLFFRIGDWLVGEISVSLPRVFHTILQPPNAHEMVTQDNARLLLIESIPFLKYTDLFVGAFFEKDFSRRAGQRTPQSGFAWRAISELASHQAVAL